MKLSKQETPSINITINRVIRKKKWLWKKVKQNQTEKDWQEFKDIRKKVKKSIENK